ncbi:MAG: hypothetical protein ACHQFW_06910 [Chitinophagales bacterium]
MRITITVIILVSSLSLYCQTDAEYPQRILFEAGGNGGVYSFNYEHDFEYFWQGNLKWEVGLSYSPFFGKNIIAIPLAINYVIGKSKHKMELGTGQVLIIAPGEEHGGFIRGTFDVGYLLQPDDKRVYYKFAYTPFYSYTSNFQYQHWGALGIGYQLK